MTGTDPSAIAERRGRIVTRLATDLRLPPDEIAETLEKARRPPLIRRWALARGGGGCRAAEAEPSPDQAEAPDRAG